MASRNSKKSQSKPSSAKFMPVGETAVADVFEKMKSNIENHMENTMQNATDQIENAQREFVNQVENFTSFHRNNAEACVRAANILAQGLKDMSEAAASTVQNTMENTMATSKAALAVKSVRDLVDLQAQYMKGVYDSMLSESTKLSEIAVRCTSEAAEPISERVNDVVVKFTERAKKAA